MTAEETPRQKLMLQIHELVQISTITRPPSDYAPSFFAARDFADYLVNCQSSNKLAELIIADRPGFLSFLMFTRRFLVLLNRHETEPNINQPVSNCPYSLLALNIIDFLGGSEKW